MPALGLAIAVVVLTVSIVVDRSQLINGGISVEFFSLYVLQTLVLVLLLMGRRL